MSLRWVSAISAVVVSLAAITGGACAGARDEPGATDAGFDAQAGSAGTGGGTAGASGAAASGGIAGAANGGAGGLDAGQEDADANPPTGELVRSSVPYDPSPDVSPDDVFAVSNAIGTFGLDLFASLAGNDGLILSPHSIGQCLAMLYAGARGETEQQMANTLHFPFGQQTVHKAFNALSIELESRATQPNPNATGFELDLSNGIWIQHGYPIEPGFLDVMSESYDAGVYRVDFAGDNEGVIDFINQWIETNTNGLIKQMVDKSFITPMTRFAAGNALYFRASWETVFSSYKTVEEPFTLLDGTQVNVPMMHQTSSYTYGIHDGYKAVRIGYVGYDVSMLVIVPDEGQFETVRGQLSHAMFANAINAGGMFEYVTLAFPKFETHYKKLLRGTLSGLGMPNAFSAFDADFSGLTPGDFALWDVLHEAIIKVDEEGTEAAAATMGSGGGSPGITPTEITVNRPFIYVIQDEPTGAVLFIGQYLGPAS